MYNRHQISRYIKILYIYQYVLLFSCNRLPDIDTFSTKICNRRRQDSEHLRAAPKMMKRSGYCCPGGTQSMAIFLSFLQFRSLHYVENFDVKHG